ncbi:MAG: aminoglycoside phosphotransferase family protein [Cohaesibacteraceae bacterium]
MHADEVILDGQLVHAMVMAQCPQWANRPLELVDSAGTDHALYRLGDEFLVRLPRRPPAAPQVRKETRWLPKLGDGLPLAIPAPRFLGQGIDDYPFEWAIYDWLEGDSPPSDLLAGDEAAARALADFLIALHRLDASAGPLAGDQNHQRGLPLPSRDRAVRQALEAVDALGVSSAYALSIWRDYLDVEPWKATPRWVHGDIQAGNVLYLDGHLHAVIDFGLLGIGDPAVDLAVAWTAFNAGPRELFRAALSDRYPGFDALWARARGWAFSIALIQLPYYAGKSAGMEAMARRTLREVFADHEM